MKLRQKVRRLGLCDQSQSCVWVLPKDTKVQISIGSTLVFLHVQGIFRGGTAERYNRRKE